MAIPFLNSINLNDNHLENAKVHVTSTAPTAEKGQIYLDSTNGVNKLKYYNGTAWITLGGDYVHPTFDGDDISLDTDGATVIDGLTITTDTNGHVTDASVTTRTLTLADLGYTGDTDANNYAHPDHTGHVTSTGDGDTVLTVAAITGQTELASGLESTDEFVISDGGVIKKMDVSVLQTYMQDNLGFLTGYTDVDVTVANLITRLGQISEDFTIGDDTDVTATFSGGVIVSGDLTVSGTTTTVNTETINLADNIITLNSNATGTPSENAGLEVERGDSANVSLLWDEGADRWTFTNDGTNYYNIPISSEYDNFNFNVQVGSTSQEVADGGTVTFAQGGGLTVGISDDDTITYTHADTSSQASVDNSGRTYIQDITLDTYGHITGITSATETVTNTDTQLATKEADIDVSDTDFIANKRATINHALNSENVIVQMYDKTTGAVVHADVEHTSDGSTISKNHVRIEFGVVPANDIRVIMIDAKDGATSVTPSYS